MAAEQPQLSSPWYDMIAARDPAVRLADFVGATGLGVRTAYCAPRCFCAQAWQAEECGARLPYLGFRVRGGGCVRCPRPYGGRGSGAAAALCDLAADWLSPPVRRRCESRRRETCVAHGLAAYDLWMGDLAAGKRLGGGVRTAAITRAEYWTWARLECGEYLARRSGRGRTPVSLRLRAAAAAMGREHAVLARLARAPSRGFRTVAIQLLAEARSEAETGAGLLLDAALRAAGVADGVRVRLLEEPESPISWRDARELVYLARAGVRSLRVLAARRLAGSDDPMTVSTLSQLTTNDDPYIAATAAWAMGRATPAAAAARLPRT